MPVITYSQAADLLKGRQGYKLANQTLLTQSKRFNNNAYGIMYYKTEIITIYKSGRYRLYTGGWRTETTLKRLWEFSPAIDIYRQNGVLFIVEPEGTREFHEGYWL